MDAGLNVETVNLTETLNTQALKSKMAADVIIMERAIMTFCSNGFIKYLKYIISFSLTIKILVIFILLLCL